TPPLLYKAVALYCPRRRLQQVHPAPAEPLVCHLEPVREHQRLPQVRLPQVRLPQDRLPQERLPFRRPRLPLCVTAFLSSSCVRWRRLSSKVAHSMNRTCTILSRETAILINSGRNRKGVWRPPASQALHPQARGRPHHHPRLFPSPARTSLLTSATLRRRQQLPLRPVALPVSTLTRSLSYASNSKSLLPRPGPGAEKSGPKHPWSGRLHGRMKTGVRTKRVRTGQPACD